MMREIRRLKRRLVIYISVLPLLFFYTCSKEKLDMVYDNKSNETALSDVRFINTGAYRNLVFNGDTLTYSGREWSKGTPPTEHFEDPYQYGYLSHDWRVPKHLFSTDDNLFNLSYVGAGDDVRFSIPKSYVNKKIDYYTIRQEGVGQNWVVPVERDETSPSNPNHFKIRVVNLTKQLPNLNTPSYFGDSYLDNYYGPLTLTFADGTPVSSQTTNVDQSQRVSEYVELPFGSYQFKIFTTDGRQLSAAEHGVNKTILGTRFMVPSSSLMAVILDNNPLLSANTFSPVLHYQAGGVYTIAIVPSLFVYAQSSTETNIAVQNQFLVIEDYIPETKPDLLKVQMVNASDERIRVRIEGEQLSSLNFSEYSDYKILEWRESIYCEVLDIQGNVIAEQYIKARPQQHISLFYWVNSEGLPEVVPIYNNLDDMLPFQRFDDYGAFNRLELNHGLGMRFLNFCPELVSANFTYDIGQFLPFNLLHGNYPENKQAYMQVEQGNFKTSLPYLYWDDFLGLNTTFNMLVYRNNNLEFPGEYLSAVKGLSNEHFVANKELYTRVGRPIPAFEAGVYSVVLLGSLKADAKNPAKLILIKHTQ